MLLFLTVSNFLHFLHNIIDSSSPILCRNLFLFFFRYSLFLSFLLFVLGLSQAHSFLLTSVKLLLNVFSHLLHLTISFLGIFGSYKSSITVKLFKIVPCFSFSTIVPPPLW